jgi:citrate lyase subunit beta/citryl-CoA lyase
MEGLSMAVARTGLPLSPLRSLLFVPGIRAELVEKALATGVDALVLDLEDSVPPPRREEARANVAAVLARYPDRLTFIRINHPSEGELEQDLSVLAPHPMQGLMAPKVDGPGDIAEIDARLSAFERAAGLEPYAISLMVVIETALGLRNFYDTVASTPRVRGAGLATANEGDLMADLGAQWTPEGEALAYARGKFVVDGRATKGMVLFDGPLIDIQDTAGLERESRLARRLGFDGKVAIHPRQVATIHEAFSVSAQEVARARHLIEVFREAEAKGLGAVQVDGTMVDYANVRRAERILALAGLPVTP